MVRRARGMGAADDTRERWDHDLPLDDDPLALPPAWEPPRRPPLPLLASVVPVVGAVVLWAVTGSVIALWLAALGPLIVVATSVDARRAARRDRRVAVQRAARERETVVAAVARRHDAERARLRRAHPDVRDLLGAPDAIWRSGAGEMTLVVGAGDAPSTLRVRGGEGDPESLRIRAGAAVLSGAPLAMTASDGLMVSGSPVVAAAVHRALTLQLCLAHPPGELRLDADPAVFPWAQDLPHRRATSGARLALVAPGRAAPAGTDIVLACGADDDVAPPGCRARLDVRSPDSAFFRAPGVDVAVTTEAVSVEQAVAVAGDLAERAVAVLGWAVPGSGPVRLGELLEAHPGPVDGGLAVPLGRIGDAEAVVDLVADGPHAVVAGVTGSGKSELLITWIVAVCAIYPTEQVTFLLADFKGGTAFDSLLDLPHVTGVITDLDGAGARRAVESLRAEIRRREAAIARSGARDIADPRVGLARLVVVVDEFAALVSEHPELAGVFADVAARGRALGIHLVLGTQRAAGVIRDGLLVNCPLRVSLRAEPTDSRFVIGTDDAGSIPGGASGRGQAFVRRAGDLRPWHLTVALTAADDIAQIDRGSGRPQRPWLPPLPERIDLASLRPAPGAGHDLVLGLVDEPEHQRQRAVGLSSVDRGLLIVGGPASGRTTAVSTLIAQAAAAMSIPADPEQAWDAVTALVEEPVRPGRLIAIDDVDALVARFPLDYAQAFAERVEAVVRETGANGGLAVVTAQRLSGPIARVADLLPRRLILGLPSRMDHVAAGGDATGFVASAPPGRGHLDGLATQVALAAEPGGEQPGPASAPSPAWHPHAALTGVVARRSPAVRAALSAWRARGAHVVTLEEYAGEPGLVVAGPLVVTGEPDEWQRHWRLLADVRGDHDLVVDTACAAELRLLAGVRELPPYCAPGRARAWLMSAGSDPVRIALPTVASGAPSSGMVRDRPPAAV